jgi:stage II sporulation protein D
MSLTRVAIAATTLATVLALNGPAPALASPGLAVHRGDTIKIAGRGFGHGHGMSQYGAQGAAKQGRSTAQILSFYYPHTGTAQRSGHVRDLITENIGKATTIVARPGLRVRDLSGTTHTVPSSGPASRASRWRMTGGGAGGTRVSYLNGTGWHFWKQLKGNGEFRSTKSPLTLVLPQGLVTYRGTLRSMGSISKTTHHVTVNVVSLESYVRGVVPREMPSGWRPAALRAQAVAARTFASHAVEAALDDADQRFNLCDSTACQVYGGKTAEVASTDQATAATAGRVLTYGGHPAFTQFSSSNGGQLAPGGQPYLVGKPDPYDTAAIDPNFSWTVKVSAARIQNTWPSLGRLTSIEVTQRDGSGRWGGRVLALTLHGTTGNVSFGGTGRKLGDFAGALGLRSTYVDFSIAGR